MNLKLLNRSKTKTTKVEETVAVGSIASSKKVSYFSSKESQVDIVVPREQVLPTYPTSNYAELSGSSMNTLFVSGIIALMFSKLKRFSGKNPLQDRQELVRRHLRETATNIGPDKFDPGYGYGITNPEDLLFERSRFLLDLILSDDLTKSGKEKISKFINRRKSNSSFNDPEYLGRSTRDSSDDIRGGIRIVGQCLICIKRDFLIGRPLITTIGQTRPDRSQKTGEGS